MSTSRPFDGIALAHRFRTVEFRLALRGYNVEEVDSWLEEAAVAISATPSSTDALRAPPSRRTFKVSLRGYDCRMVDDFVEEVFRAFESRTGLDYGDAEPPST